MNSEYKKASKNISVIIAVIVVAIILLCFLYSVIQLIMEPAKICVIENGKIYDEESTVRIYNKR